MNKLIHKGYFWEIFRQLKVAAIVSAGVLAISNLSYFLVNFAIFSGITQWSLSGLVHYIDVRAKSDNPLNQIGFVAFSGIMQDGIAVSVFYVDVSALFD